MNHDYDDSKDYDNDVKGNDDDDNDDDQFMRFVKIDEM